MAGHGVNQYVYDVFDDRFKYKIFSEFAGMQLEITDWFKIGMIKSQTSHHLWFMRQSFGIAWHVHGQNQFDLKSKV